VVGAGLWAARFVGRLAAKRVLVSAVRSGSPKLPLEGIIRSSHRRAHRYLALRRAPKAAERGREALTSPSGCAAAPTAIRAERRTSQEDDFNTQGRVTVVFRGNWAQATDIARTKRPGPRTGGGGVA